MPIFKRGDKTLVFNFRPISKQNLMSKIFENIITGKLSTLFKNIIIEEQHGFVSGRSVATNHLLYQNFITRLLREVPKSMLYILTLEKLLIMLITLS
ncbi:hypothetical protein ACFW04_011822 [Cataglyphis niger]